MEKMLPASCIPSPESPEKRTTTCSNSFTSKFSAIEFTVLMNDFSFISLNSRSSGYAQDIERAMLFNKVMQSSETLMKVQSFFPK